MTKDRLWDVADKLQLTSPSTFKDCRGEWSEPLSASVWRPSWGRRHNDSFQLRLEIEIQDRRNATGRHLVLIQGLLKSITRGLVKENISKVGTSKRLNNAGVRPLIIYIITCSLSHQHVDLGVLVSRWSTQSHSVGISFCLLEFLEFFVGPCAWRLCWKVCMSSYFTTLRWIVSICCVRLPQKEGF